MKILRAISLVVVALTACGRSPGAIEIPREELPFPVARSAHPTITSAPSRSFTIYLVREDRLMPSVREVEQASPAPEAALRSLLEGPNTDDRARGVTSELPSAVRLLGVSVAAGTALVDLSGEFQEPAQPERITLRVAQVVWTLTQLPGVTAVRFAIDGEVQSVTTADGTSVARPVGRSDYSTVAPE